MRKRAITALVLALTAPAAEAAPGKPEVVRAWRAADERIHPGARHEQWLLRATDRRTGHVFVVSLTNYESHEFARIEVGVSSVDGVGDAIRQRFAPAGGEPRWAGEGGTTVVRRSKSGLFIRVRSRQVNGWARLRGGRPGISALGWRIHQIDNSNEPSHWTMPFADGRVDASFTLKPLPGVSLPDGRFRLRGWRGTYGHMWGGYGRPIGAHFNEFTTWTGGTTWHLIGTNRPDVMIGARPSKRDPAFAGVLARIGAGGIRICRPKVRRGRWGWPAPPHDVLDSLLYHANVVTARCALGKVRFERLVGPSRGEGLRTFFEDQFTTARSSRRARGIAWTFAG